MSKKKKNSNYKATQKAEQTTQKPKKKMIDGWMFISGALIGGGAILIDRFVFDLPEWAEVGCLAIAVVLLLAYMSNARAEVQKRK
ncbi:MAG: hypothetical protein IJP33_01585 [Firmicutes bacterium]|nr:hypothetical protein [Bacillota bacterium]